MIWLLLLVYQVKHFVADYPLQNSYMLGKFRNYPDYVMPLLCHASVHGVCTYLIALTIKPELAVKLAMFDMACHFIVDRIKASPNMLGRFKPLTADNYLVANQRQRESNTYFWWSLGADQMAHHLTHYLIIYWMVS